MEHDLRRVGRVFEAHRAASWWASETRPTLRLEAFATLGPVAPPWRSQGGFSWRTTSAQAAEPRNSSPGLGLPRSLRPTRRRAVRAWNPSRVAIQGQALPHPFG